MLDRRSPPLSRVKAFGWAWHGLMLQPRGSSSVTIYLPGGQTYAGTTAGVNKILRPAPWTYLWNLGLADQEQTEAEAERGAQFTGYAILRGSSGPLYAYGNAYFGTYDALEICGWPVRFAAGTGRALLRIRRNSSGEPDPDTLELLIYPSVVLGGEPADPFFFTFDGRLDALGQGAGQPDLYEGAEALAPLVTGVRFSSLDMSANGRSLLLGLTPLVSANLLRMTNVAQWCGLLRLDIAGDPSEPETLSAELSVEQDRGQALGELVDEITGSMNYVARYTKPAETVSTVQPFPDCGVTEVVQTAGFTSVPNASPGVASYEGNQTYRHGQTGSMAGAWFDGAGAVQVLRFDSIREQHLVTSVEDASSGERRERDIYVAGATECVLDDRTLTDDRAYRLNGLVTDERTFTVRLYGPGGGLFDEQVLKTTFTNTEWYDSTQDPDNQGTARMVIEYDGEVISDVTSPPDGGSLSPGSGTPFGYQVDVLPDRYQAEAGGQSVGEHHIRVLNGSNKIALMGHAVITTAGPDAITFRNAVTPAGTATGVMTRYASHDGGLQPRAGFDSSDARALTRGSYNPITHQVERHREDRAELAWI